MVQVLEPVIRVVSRWAERSQRGACRNAMVATTILAERRQERLDVAEYLDRTLALGTHRAGAAPPPLPAARLG